MFRDFAPRFVLRRPDYVAVVVGQFLLGAEVVPGQRIQRQGFGFMRPHLILINFVGVFVGRLGRTAFPREGLAVPAAALFACELF